MSEVDKPQVLTVGLLKKYLSIYQDDLPVTVETPSGLLGILDVGTKVAEPGRVLVVSATTNKYAGRKVEPVEVVNV